MPQINGNPEIPNSPKFFMARPPISLDQFSEKMSRVEFKWSLYKVNYSLKGFCVSLVIEIQALLLTISEDYSLSVMCWRLLLIDAVPKITSTRN